MKRELVIAVAAAMGLSACGGGSSSSTSSTSATGFAIPTEISAVPTNSSAAASLKRGLASHLHALARSLNTLPADSDYNKTSTRKYVEEHSLEQFSIIETIMKALAQTEYADAANIGAGPYKAMIAWEENNGNSAMKTLEPWVVDSSLITVNGQTVNRVQAWIEDSSGDATKLVKADFDIYQSATQNADGSYADYGKWNLTAKFNADGTQFFSGTADIVNGQTVLMINSHQVHDDGQGNQVPEDVQAVMYRAGADGYGKVSYPDMDCSGNNGCVPAPNKNATYAYNADYVAVDDGSGTVVYKDRNAKTDLTQRYGLFYAAAAADDGNGKAIAAGDSLMKHKSFGFPVSYTDTNTGATAHAYYGAWNGRHSLWSSGGSVPAGTTVTREDHTPGAAAETYTVSAALNGTLTKRTLVTADLSDIQNIPFETFVNKNLNLQWDGSNWMGCAGFMDWSTQPPTCKDMNGNTLATSAFTDFGLLVVQSSSDRKMVNINRWDPNTQSPVDYVYLDDTNGTGVTGYTTPGFYPATRNQSNGQLTVNTPAVLYVPSVNDMINVNIGGSIYIQYTGDFTNAHTGWVQKTLESFDQQTWTPTFVVGGDTDFVPELGKEYYIHNNGANFVVNRIAATNASSDYAVMIELQTAANPSNVASILPANTSYLASPWNKSVHFALDATAADPNFMMLMYTGDDPNTTNVVETSSTVLTSGQWGLQAYNDNGTPNDSTDDVLLAADGTSVSVDANGIPTGGIRPVQFNWEYADPNSGNTFGAQQFLVDGNGAYKLLSDPVTLNPMTVTDGAGNSKTLSLQFDGWMHGLPDMYNELSKSGWVMTADIANKAINIPEDTLVTDSNSTQYYMKPLEVSEFLTVVTSAATGKTLPDASLATASALDLTTVGLPTFVEYNMGDTPTNSDGSPLDPKYSEGNLVE